MSTATPESAQSDAVHEDGPAPSAPDVDAQREQRRTVQVGMWLFLAEEFLFFAGLLVAYAAFCSRYPVDFGWAAQQLNRWLGGASALALLGGSLTAALAARGAQRDDRKATGVWLVVTIACGVAFLAILSAEYVRMIQAGLLPGAHFLPSPEQLAAGTQQLPIPRHGGTFFGLYFVTTGLLALHVLVGLGLLVGTALRNRRGVFSAAYSTPVELVALYGHLLAMVCTASTLAILLAQSGPLSLALAVMIGTAQAGFIIAFLLRANGEDRVNSLILVGALFFVSAVLMSTLSDTANRGLVDRVQGTEVDDLTGVRAPGGMP